MWLSSVFRAQKMRLNNTLVCAEILICKTRTTAASFKGHKWCLWEHCNPVLSLLLWSCLQPATPAQSRNSWLYILIALEPSIHSTTLEWGINIWWNCSFSRAVHGINLNPPQFFRISVRGQSYPQAIHWHLIVCAASARWTCRPILRDSDQPQRCAWVKVWPSDTSWVPLPLVIHIQQASYKRRQHVRRGSDTSRRW